MNTSQQKTAQASFEALEETQLRGSRRLDEGVVAAAMKEKALGTTGFECFSIVFGMVLVWLVLFKGCELRVPFDIPPFQKPFGAAGPNQKGTFICAKFI